MVQELHGILDHDKRGWFNEFRELPTGIIKGSSINYYPPRVVPFPVIYFVREWITILAPCSMGFKSEGEAIVLSTIKGTLASLACLLIPSKSITSSFGFPKDSAKKLWCLA